MNDKVFDIFYKPEMVKLHTMPANVSYHPEVSTLFHSVMNLALMDYGISQGMWGSNVWSSSIREDARLIATLHDSGKVQGSQFTLPPEDMEVYAELYPKAVYSKSKRKIQWQAVSTSDYWKVQKFNSIGHERKLLVAYEMLEQYGIDSESFRAAGILSVIEKHMQKVVGRRTAGKLREHFTNPMIMYTLKNCRQLLAAILTTDHFAKANLPESWVGATHYPAFSMATSEPTPKLLEAVYHYTQEKIATKMKLPPYVQALGNFERYS